MDMDIVLRAATSLMLVREIYDVFYYNLVLQLAVKLGLKDQSVL